MRKMQKDEREKAKETEKGLTKDKENISSDGTDVLPSKSKEDIEKDRKEMREKQRMDFQAFKAAQRAEKGIKVEKQVILYVYNLRYLDHNCLFYFPSFFLNFKLKNYGVPHLTSKSLFLKHKNKSALTCFFLLF